MRQALATKERHKSRGKRLKSLIKCEQGWFCTHRVSDEDGDKIHELIGPESRTRKTYLFLDVFEDARCDEDLRHDGDLLEYIIMPLSLIVWLVEAIREAVSHLLLSSIPSRA